MRVWFEMMNWITLLIVCRAPSGSGILITKSLFLSYWWVCEKVDEAFKEVQLASNKIVSLLTEGPTRGKSSFSVTDACCWLYFECRSVEDVGRKSPKNISWTLLGNTRVTWKVLSGGLFANIWCTVLLFTVVAFACCNPSLRKFPWSGGRGFCLTCFDQW